MYWDVVEVKAEPGHRLFVRFADGTSGKVQLNLSELSGVLSFLRDPLFFERAFVDHGAVAWPGTSISRRMRCISRWSSKGARVASGRFVAKAHKLIRTQGAGRVRLSVVVAELHFKHSWC